MPEIGVPELLIIAVIALLIFGPAKAADLGGALGKGIREFRRESKDGAGDEVAAASAPAADARFCTECGARNAKAAAFCDQCGAPSHVTAATAGR